MSREEKINFIINNDPQFDDETPQKLKDSARKELEKLSDKDLQEEYGWVDYLLDK